MSVFRFVRLGLKRRMSRKRICINKNYSMYPSNSLNESEAEYRRLLEENLRIRERQWDRLHTNQEPALVPPSFQIIETKASGDQQGYIYKECDPHLNPEESNTHIGVKLIERVCPVSILDGSDTAVSTLQHRNQYL